MEAWGLARAVHVLGVVLWIGGVAMVTLVILPVARRYEGRSGFALFERIEERFAGHARWTTLLTGLSGLYLVESLDLWGRFTELRYWWMHAMVIVWAIFTLLIFVLEPAFLHARLAARARRDAPGTLRAIERGHWALLVLSLVTIAGAVAGSHGLLMFGG